MLKATLVFCVIGVTPCTKNNATLIVPLPGECQFAALCKNAHIKTASQISKQRGNGEYFEILVEPK